MRSSGRRGGAGGPSRGGSRRRRRTPGGSRSARRPSGRRPERAELALDDGRREVWVAQKEPSIPSSERSSMTPRRSMPSATRDPPGAPPTTRPPARRRPARRSRSRREPGPNTFATASCSRCHSRGSGPRIPTIALRQVREWDADPVSRRHRGRDDEATGRSAGPSTRGRRRRCRAVPALDRRPGPAGWLPLGSSRPAPGRSAWRVVEP